MGRGEPEWDVQAYLLRHLEGAVCDLLRFPGNYGDALIWHGTREILSRSGVQYTSIQCEHQPSSDTLIVDGGGNLVDLYSDVRLYLDAFGTRYSRIVILPHTITGSESLACLRRLRSRVVVFCRELMSYAEVRGSAPEAEVFLWHDCGLSASVHRGALIAGGSGSTLVAYRTDVESIHRDRSRDPGNRDLALEGYAMSSLDHMVDVLSRYERVVTDRLHIAIAASLLGCDVVLHPNSYYKNRAVYEYSLVHLKNVRFGSA